MAKKTTATQPKEPTEAAPSVEVQVTDGLGNVIGESDSAPKLKETSDIITELHTAWDNLTANGKDAEAEFMAVINSKLSGKTHDEVKAIHQQAQQNAMAVADQFDADAEWQQRNAAHRAAAEANKQTRIDRAKRNSRR